MTGESTSPGSWLLFGAIGTYILGFISSYLSRLWQLLFLTIRIPRSKIAKLYYYLNTNKTYSFSFVEGYSSNSVGNLPDVETSFIICKKIPIWLHMEEKYLTAGWASKEEILTITVFRFHKTSLFKMFGEAETQHISLRKHVEVYINNGSFFRQLNKLDKAKFSSGLYLDPKVTTDLNKLLEDFRDGKRQKSGILLYGPPGNGKTSLIKHVACNYDYNIYIPVIRPDMTSDVVINLFADIPIDETAIIVLEDFDNLFCGRYPENRDAKYSFDAFLNILDGLYINMDNKLIFLTCNNVSKIDKAIKNRPSRIDYVLELGNPDHEARINILCKHGLSKSVAESISTFVDGKSAAIVAEVGKRNPSGENIVDEVKKIVDSFIEDKNVIEPMKICEPSDPVAEGIFQSFNPVYSHIARL